MKDLSRNPIIQGREAIFIKKLHQSSEISGLAVPPPATSLPPGSAWRCPDTTTIPRYVAFNPRLYPSGTSRTQHPQSSYLLLYQQLNDPPDDHRTVRTHTGPRFAPHQPASPKMWRFICSPRSRKGKLQMPPIQVMSPTQRRRLWLAMMAYAALTVVLVGVLLTF